MDKKDLEAISQIVKVAIEDSNKGLKKDLREEIKQSNEILKQELREEIKQSNETLKEELREEIKQSNETLKEELRGEIKQSNEALKEELRGEIKQSNEALRNELHEEMNAFEKRMLDRMFLFEQEYGKKIDAIFDVAVMQKDKIEEVYKNQEKSRIQVDNLNMKVFDLDQRVFKLEHS